MDKARPGIRLDKWLWQARFFKTRTLASKNVNAGHIYVNEVKASKAATKVYVDDDLRFVQGRTERIIRIAALGERRGPATEAQALYVDFTPKQEKFQPSVPDHRSDKHTDRQGRPTKRNRRAMEALFKQD